MLSRCLNSERVRALGSSARHPWRRRDSSTDDPGPRRGVAAIGPRRRYLVRRGVRSGLPDSGRAVSKIRPPSARAGVGLLPALAWLKDRRPIASPHPAYVDALVAWEVAWRPGPPSLDAALYRENRYEDVARLGFSRAPRPKMAGRRRAAAARRGSRGATPPRARRRRPRWSRGRRGR